MVRHIVLLHQMYTCISQACVTDDLAIIMMWHSVQLLALLLIGPWASRMSRCGRMSASNYPIHLVYIWKPHSRILSVRDMQSRQPLHCSYCAHPATMCTFWAFARGIPIPARHAGLAHDVVCSFAAYHCALWQ